MTIEQALQEAQIPFVTEEPLSRHTTFKIGGTAAALCTPRTQDEVCRVVQLCREAQVRYYFLGKGSNVLFSDAGFDGVIIHLGGEFSAIRTEGECITAEAGTSLSCVCQAAANAGLAGLAFAFGIPGSVGGAVCMNAGAYGGEIKDVLESVTFIDEQGNVCTLPAEKLALGYRTSLFTQQETLWCILSATFRLQKGDSAQIRAQMTEFAQRRAEKQPLDMPSAGSAFKRPEGAYAGALIDSCGLRGFAVGGACISEKHCGFVVNKGGATCADVIALTDTVCKIVEEKTGYHLEKEIRVVK